MALRNIDLDSAVRAICHGDSEQFGALAAACKAKMKSLGIQADSGKAVGRVPRHRGRRNPLAGQFKGSADVNVRSLIDFVESIDLLPTLSEGEESTPAFEESRDAMQAAHDALQTLSATIAAHAK